MKIEEIAIWEAFLAVGRSGNFSKAAASLRTSVPQISKRIAKLEDQLGVRLFRRSTRVVTLTDEGRSLLPKVSAILEDLSAVESSFENTGDLSGTIRITAVPFIAHRLLLPVFAKFRKLHPKVDFELDLSEGVLNLLESNIDLALRIYDEPEDSSLIYRKLLPNELIFCASPSYLKANPSPLKTPEDLRKHEVLALSVHAGCEFHRDGRRVEGFLRNRKIVCENGWYLTQLALGGAGVLLRSAWDVREYLEKGELVQVLKKHPIEGFGSIYAVMPSRRLLAPRVRAFFDFLTQAATSVSFN